MASARVSLRWFAQQGCGEGVARASRLTVVLQQTDGGDTINEFVVRSHLFRAHRVLEPYNDFYGELSFDMIM